MKGGVHGQIDLESIDVESGEGKGKASEADFQLEVVDSPLKNAQTKTSTATPPSSYHQSSENAIEVDDSLVNDAHSEPSTSTPPSSHHQISEITIEIMPQDQKEISKRSSAESRGSFRSMRSTMSMVSETVRKNKKSVLVMASVSLLLYTVIVVSRILAMKGDGEGDQHSGNNTIADVST